MKQRASEWMGEKERRRSPRNRLDGEVECGIISVDRAELHDISHEGVRFKSLKRLSPNSKQKIVLHFDASTLNLRGTIVRSMIYHSRTVEGREAPVYEIALTFEKPLEDISHLL